MLAIDLEDVTYVRPGSAWVNERLPFAPFTVKSSSKPYLSRREEISLRAAGMVSGAIAVMVVFLASLATLWTLKAGMLFPFFNPEEVELLMRKGWGFISVVLVMAGTLLGYWAIVWSPRRLRAAEAVQRRFVMGAENWSGTERLRAIMLYAFASPWCLMVPLLAVPLRLAHGGICTVMYLILIRRAHVATVTGAIAVYANVVAWTLVFLTGMASLYVALTVTVPSI